MNFEDFLINFFDVDNVEKLNNEEVQITLRGVSKSNFKEFFQAILQAGEPERNLKEISRILEEKKVFEDSEWEKRLE